MNYSQLKDNIKGTVILDAPMKKYTTWKIGGNADCLVLPADAADVVAAQAFCREHQVSCRVIGNGSNLLVLDGGVEGVVIRIGEGMNGYTVDGTLVTAGSGCVLARLARETAKLGLAGLEWAVGIPASIGGAAYMNAGAYGHCFYETLEAVEAIDSNGNICNLSVEELTYSYRHTRLMEEGYIVTKAMIRLKEGDAASLTAAADETMHLRREKQPLEYPSAGSTFKRPEGYYAGELIMKAGMRGFTVGGAQVSEKHCGFVINTGTAASADIIEVIEKVQESVKNTFGVQLEPEVILLGER